MVLLTGPGNFAVAEVPSVVALVLQSPVTFCAYRRKRVTLPRGSTTHQRQRKRGSTLTNSFTGGWLHDSSANSCTVPLPSHFHSTGGAGGGDGDGGAGHGTALNVGVSVVTPFGQQMPQDVGVSKASMVFSTPLRIPRPLWQPRGDPSGSFVSQPHLYTR
eukprot:COSAG01_NODE_16575_length_1224_cov_2.055111_2_plen_160_part_00